MERPEILTDTVNASIARQRLIPCTVAIVTLVICVVLAIGWTVHCNKLKAANDELRTANEGLTASNSGLNITIESLRAEITKLEGQLATLADRTGETIDELTAMNRTLGNTNEKLADEIAGIRKGIEAMTAENLKLIDQITQMHEDARSRTAESGRHIEELTGAIMKLTGDLNAANSRLDGLVAELRAKTEEAADQTIRINTLVEMVARLRVLVGLSTEHESAGPPADPNSAAPAPAPALPAE